MVAIVVSAELHVPPPTRSDKVVSLPAHKMADPVMGSGAEFTVTMTVV